MIRSFFASALVLSLSLISPKKGEAGFSLELTVGAGTRTIDLTGAEPGLALSNPNGGMLSGGITYQFGSVTNNNTDSLTLNDFLINGSFSFKTLTLNYLSLTNSLQLAFTNFTVPNNQLAAPPTITISGTRSGLSALTGSGTLGLSESVGDLNNQFRSSVSAGGQTLSTLNTLTPGTRPDSIFTSLGSSYDLSTSFTLTPPPPPTIVNAEQPLSYFTNSGNVTASLIDFGSSGGSGGSNTFASPAPPAVWMALSALPILAGFFWLRRRNESALAISV